MTVLERTILYANPIPHLRSRHGYFPGVTALQGNELLALFAMGEAFESTDMTTVVSRSADGGHTWSLEGPVWPRAGGHDSDCMKAALLRDGRLLAMGYRFHREGSENPLVNAETNGIRPGEVIRAFSRDGGRTWTCPEPVPLPFREVVEVSGAPLVLRNGEVLAGGGLFRPWDGRFEAGQRGELLRSRDGGHNWSCEGAFFEVPARDVTPFETRFCEMQEGRVVALVWGFDQMAGRNLGNWTVVSHDGGRTWSAPRPTGITAQSSHLLWLGGDRLLTVHAHRSSPEGLYLRVVDFADDTWRIVWEECLWNGRSAGEHGGLAGMAAALRFGQPSVVALEGGDYLLVHWSIEEGQGLIRAHRFRL